MTWFSQLNNPGSLVLRCKELESRKQTYFKDIIQVDESNSACIQFKNMSWKEGTEPFKQEKQTASSHRRRCFHQMTLRNRTLKYRGSVIHLSKRAKSRSVMMSVLTGVRHSGISHSLTVGVPSVQQLLKTVCEFSMSPQLSCPLIQPLFSLWDFTKSWKPYPFTNVLVAIQNGNSWLLKPGNNQDVLQWLSGWIFINCGNLDNGLSHTKLERCKFWTHGQTLQET